MHRSICLYAMYIFACAQSGYRVGNGEHVTDGSSFEFTFMVEDECNRQLGGIGGRQEPPILETIGLITV